MAYALDSQKKTEALVSTPSLAQPAADYGVGGAESWGNAALAEQIPAVSAGESPMDYGSGKTEAEPWWSQDPGEECSEGEVSVQGAYESFWEEIAKPHPNATVVYNLLMQMNPASLQDVHQDAAIWAKINGLLSPSQLARVEEASIGIKGGAAFSLQMDQSYQQVVAALKRNVGAWVEGQISELVGILGVNGSHTPTTQISGFQTTVSVEQKTADDLGIKDPQLAVRLGGKFTTTLVGDGLYSTTVSSIGSASLEVEHPSLGTTVFPEGFVVPEFSAIFVRGYCVKGTPEVVWNS